MTDEADNAASKRSPAKKAPKKNAKKSKKGGAK